MLTLAMRGWSSPGGLVALISTLLLQGMLANTVPGETPLDDNIFSQNNPSYSNSSGTDQHPGMYAPNSEEGSPAQSDVDSVNPSLQTPGGDQLPESTGDALQATEDALQAGGLAGSTTDQAVVTPTRDQEHSTRPVTSPVLDHSATEMPRHTPHVTHKLTSTVIEPSTTILPGIQDSLSQYVYQTHHADHIISTAQFIVTSVAADLDMSSTPDMSTGDITTVGTKMSDTNSVSEHLPGKPLITDTVIHTSSRGVLSSRCKPGSACSEGSSITPTFTDKQPPPTQSVQKLTSTPQYVTPDIKPTLIMPSAHISSHSKPSHSSSTPTVLISPTRSVYISTSATEKPSVLGDSYDKASTINDMVTPAPSPSSPVIENAVDGVDLPEPPIGNNISETVTTSTIIKTTLSLPSEKKNGTQVTKPAVSNPDAKTSPPVASLTKPSGVSDPPTAYVKSTISESVVVTDPPNVVDGMEKVSPTAPGETRSTVRQPTSPGLDNNIDGVDPDEPGDVLSSTQATVSVRTTSVESSQIHGHIGEDYPTTVRLRLEISWQDFCKSRFKFRDEIARIASSVLLVVTPVSPGQVWLISPECLSPAGRRKGSARERHWRRKRAASIMAELVLAARDNQYDQTLTKKLAAYLRKTPPQEAFVNTWLEGKVHDVVITDDLKTTMLPPRDILNAQAVLAGMDTSLLAGIIVGTVLASCLLALVAFRLFMVRKRSRIRMMRRSAYEPRYSTDSHNLAEAIHFSSIHGGTKYGYINTALNVYDEKDFTSNPLMYVGLQNTAVDVEALEEEFLMLPNPMPRLADIPVGAEDRNRYANVIPNPETRVELKKESKDKGDVSGYINANFVRGHMRAPQSYIATQGPLEETCGDFWRMVWQEQSTVIVMLTGLEEGGLTKCAEYFPNTDGGDTIRVYGDFQVIQIKREVKPGWIRSSLLLKSIQDKQSFEVEHLWLTCWPLHGLPDHRTMIKFLMEVRPLMDSNPGPTVVHCSPGTGRTGTMIAVDMQTLSFDDCRSVNILHCVHQMRQDRSGMVQNKDQYSFIYKVVSEYSRMQHSTSARSSVVSRQSSNV